MVATYVRRFGMRTTDSAEGLKLDAGVLAFYIDPGTRQPPILELITSDLAPARAMLRAFGCQEQAWHGPGKLNLVFDPFGIAWNVYEGETDEDWIERMERVSPIPGKIVLHLHEGAKAAAFYAELLGEAATQTPTGWTIDSNHVRLLIEPGLPHGPAFFADSAGAPDPEGLEEFFASKKSQVDEFGVTWRATTRSGPANAVVEA